MVEHGSGIHDLEDLRKNMLHGRVDEMLQGKTEIDIDNILKPLEDCSPVSLVFVGGPPGIGKSTLAWELCRRWDRKQYDLAVLLRLREKRVQQIENIADLFPHLDHDLRKSVAKEVLFKEGKGVLFILDGFDELSSNSKSKGLLIQILKGEAFPQCSVLVTSRPSATKELFTLCSPQIQRHVEILGFTQDCVKDYAASVFSSESETLKDFLLYISASKNPAITSLLYIPLNAAIMIHIYKDNKRKGYPIPKTLTQVYTQLCLRLLQRYIESTGPQSEAVNIGNHFSGLPSTHYRHIAKLCQLAFEQFEQENIVFHSDSVPKDLVHFGFLDSIPALYGGRGVSYNFLHLTLQEFLAAYHITWLTNGIEVFDHNSNSKRWEVVWKFVSGLTGFQFFKDRVKCPALASVTEEGFEVKDLLLNCTFEGQVTFDSRAVFGNSKISCFQAYYSPLDRYALGYCIANSFSTASWKVKLWCGSDESFMWGLKSNHLSNTSIRDIELMGINPIHLDSYPRSILCGIRHLTLIDLQIDAATVNHMLLHIIPLMTNLTSLEVNSPPLLGMGPNLLNVISHTKVRKLGLGYCVNLNVSNEDFLSSLRNLVAVFPFKKLKKLKIESDFLAFTFVSDGSLKPGSQVQGSTKPLCDILFGPSSLNNLKLQLPYYTDGSFELLETNRCLTTLHIFRFSEHTLSLQPLSGILQINKTIENIQWGYCAHLDDLDFEQVQALNVALLSNAVLKELTLSISDNGRAFNGCSLVLDTRVKFL